MNNTTDKDAPWCTPYLTLKHNEYFICILRVGLVGLPLPFITFILPYCFLFNFTELSVKDIKLDQH